MTAALPTCTARPATLNDLEGVAELLGRVFGKRRNADELRRKFTGCIGRLTGSVVLTYDGRIAGFLGQIPVRLRVAEREVPAVQGADMAVLQDHRRLDAFLTMIDASVRALQAEAVEVAYGTANGDATAVVAELLGQKQLARAPLLVRPIGAGAARTAPAVRLAARVIDACDGTTARGDSRLGWRVNRLERFDARFDSFWHMVRDDYRVQVVRDAAYLNWRYVDAPGAVYERICIEDPSGRVQGYAVLGVRRRGAQLRGCIADLVTARQGSARLARRLVREAVAWFRARGADIGEAWAFPHTHLRAALVRRGFIPRRTGQGGLHAGALSLPARPAMAAVEQERSWFLSLGDSDTV